MEFYEDELFYESVEHTIKIKLQSEAFKGYVTFKIRGSLRGGNILKNAIDCLWEDELDFIKNGCNFLHNKDSNTVHLELVDASGICWVSRRTSRKELENMIVSVEIIDCMALY